jgi:hypothetical protein
MKKAGELVGVVAGEDLTRRRGGKQGGKTEEKRLVKLTPPRHFLWEAYELYLGTP